MRRPYLPIDILYSIVLKESSAAEIIIRVLLLLLLVVVLYWSPERDRGEVLEKIQHKRDLFI